MSKNRNKSQTQTKTNSATPSDSNTPPSPKSETPSDVKTSKHATRYLLVGITITIFNYGFYALHCGYHPCCLSPPF